MLARCWGWGALRHSAALLLALPLLALWPAVAHAAIYSWTDAGGSVHYSDTPIHGAARLDIGRGNVVDNPGFNEKSLRKTIPYRDVSGQWHVDGQVNGVAVDFIVDTGASLVVIPRAVAAQAGIDSAGAARIRLQTANGVTEAPAVSIDHLTLGPLHVDDVRAAVRDIDASGHTGLLGMNVLGAYRITVDRARSVLVLEPR